jgi:hypothetical protein
MVQEIKGTSDPAAGLLAAGARSPKTSQDDGETNIDYTLSLKKEMVEALTYSRTGKIETGNSNGETALHDLVAGLLKRQGLTWDEAISGETVEVDDETREKAKALIADDGYWGVDQTSERIFQFAVAGVDPQKLDEIKASVQKGFDMAKEAFGGSLPDISSKTLDAVFSKLDKWAAEPSETA